MGATVGLVEGGPATAGFEIGWVPQARYLDATEDKHFAIVWLSSAYRSSYTDRRVLTAESDLFATLGIPTVTRSLADYIAERPAVPTGRLPRGLVDYVGAYQARRDAVALRAAQVSFAELTMTRVVDPGSRQTFLAVSDSEGRVLAVANLAPRLAEGDIDLAESDHDPRTVERFVATRVPWIFFKALP